MTDERSDEVQFPEDGDGREIVLLRRRLEHHRRTLAELSLSAPSERMGRLYAELTEEIDSILDRMPAVPYDASREDGASRPPMAAERSETPRPRRAPTRVGPIVAVAAILFASLAGLWLWTRRDMPAADSVTISDPTPFVPPAPPRIATLAVHPAEFDFGNVRAGGRYVQNFELSNDGDAPLRIRVERSTCRCLWFQHDEQIPPRGIIPLVVALDTSQLDPGPLSETIHVISDRPPLDATVHLSANVLKR